MNIPGTDPVFEIRENALHLVSAQALEKAPAWILQGLKYAVTQGLLVEPSTQKALCLYAPCLKKLSPKRRFGLMSRILPEITLQQLLDFAPVICGAVPELAITLGFDQRSPHHRYDLYTHIAHVVSQVPGDLTLRWAALLHDIGKPAAFTQDATGRGHFKGHAQVGAALADRLLKEMEAPRALRKRADFLILLHMTRLTPEKWILQNLVIRFGCEATRQLLALQTADMQSKGVPGEERREQFAQTQQLLEQIIQD